MHWTIIAHCLKVLVSTIVVPYCEICAAAQLRVRILYIRLEKIQMVYLNNFSNKLVKIHWS